MFDQQTEITIARMVTALTTLHPEKLPGIAARIDAYRSVVDIGQITLPLDRLAAVRYIRAKNFAWK